jgi:hypothetical protein
MLLIAGRLSSEIVEFQYLELARDFSGTANDRPPFYLKTITTIVELLNPSCEVG